MLSSKKLNLYNLRRVNEMMMLWDSQCHSEFSSLCLQQSRRSHWYHAVSHTTDPSLSPANDGLSCRSDSSTGRTALHRTVCTVCTVWTVHCRLFTVYSTGGSNSGEGGAPTGGHTAGGRPVSRAAENSFNWDRRSLHSLRFSFRYAKLHVPNWAVWFSVCTKL